MIHDGEDDLWEEDDLPEDDLWPGLHFGDDHWPDAGRTQVERWLRDGLQTRTEFLVRMGSVDDIKDALRTLKNIEEATSRITTLIVTEARNIGISWTTIGSALEVGRTAAQKRFGHRIENAEREAEEDLQGLLDRAESLITHERKHNHTNTYREAYGSLLDTERPGWHA